MSIQTLNDPFAESQSTTLDHEQVKNMSPSMPDTKAQDLMRATENQQWDKQEGVNEKFMFDKEYMSVATNISAELGPFTLDVYAQAQDLVSAGILRLINTGERTGSFRGQNARGSSQWDIEQLNVQSLNPSETDPAQYRTYTPPVGDFNVAPALDGSGTEERDPANDSSNNVGSNSDGTNSPNNNTQNIFVMGFHQSTNSRVVEQAKVDVDDGEERTAFDVYGHSNLGTLQAFQVPSVEYIDDDDNFDINGTAVSNSTTDFFPFGVNIDSAANLPSLSTNA